MAQEKQPAPAPHTATPTPPTPPTPPTAPQPPDQPSAGQQIAELKATLEAKDAELAKAKHVAAELEERLKLAHSEIAGLTGKIEHAGGSRLPDLGKGSYELATSVTIQDRQGNRITPNKGDVVSLGQDLEPLTKKVAGLARVYGVDASAVDELRKMGALRGS